MKFRNTLKYIILGGKMWIFDISSHQQRIWIYSHHCIIWLRNAFWFPSVENFLDFTALYIEKRNMTFQNEKFYHIKTAFIEFLLTHEFTLTIMHLFCCQNVMIPQQKEYFGKSIKFIFFRGLYLKIIAFNTIIFYDFMEIEF